MVSHYSGHGILSKVIILAGALCFSAYIGNRGSIPHTCETFQGITLASKPVQRCHYGELQGEGLPVFSSANCDVSAIEKKLGSKLEIGKKYSFDTKRGILDDSFVSNSVVKCKTEGERK